MAVHHNNILANNHFRKDWQRRVKVWFDQAGSKKRRRNARTAKAAKLGLKPTKSLRPAVRCPTLKYNTKLREGKGFTLEEIKAAGLARQQARAIGITVDHRRRNRSEESLKANVERLKAYKERVVVIPARTKSSKGKKPDVKSLDIVRDLSAAFPLPAGVVPEAPRAITEEEKNTEAYRVLRVSRATHRHAGVKAAREKKAAEEAAAAKK